MLSRLMILILLVLVPFQSFAAVGLIACQAPGPAAPMSSHAHMQPMQHLHDAGAADLAVAAKLAGASDAHLSHHLHKLPCCSDAPIIFSHALLEPAGSERFLMAVAPQADDLMSVFLEGPKRPPRPSFS